jgi:solute:Na+ symporter, SSS family
VNRVLGSMQVAILLISTSYGIGFLFGSGEMTLTHGMGGSIYGVTTALGMLLLAVFAARLWRSGCAIWELFGRAHGPSMERSVAFLSIVWMAGVLAAQIQGGVAIVRLLGFHEWLATAVVLIGVLIASRLNFSLASKIFGLFLVGSGMVLLYVMFAGSGSAFYCRSPLLFVQDLNTFNIPSLVSIAVGVTALVLTGADYHQFLLAARRQQDATLGCLIAAGALTVLSFIPASVVMGLTHDGGLTGLRDSRQVIPYALAYAASNLGISILGSIFLIGLLGAALGSGAAILRAMTSALKTATGGSIRIMQLSSSLIVLAIGAMLAIFGQGIVATMVSVNIIYIASISIVFGFLIAGHPLDKKCAAWVMTSGFVSSTVVYALRGANVIGPDADLTALLVGLFTSSFFLVIGRIQSISFSAQGNKH